MFKLLVLSAILAVAAANIEELFGNVPTGVSHQSSTVVHSRAAVSTPVIAEVATSPVVYAGAPVARSYVHAAAPLSYTAHSVPLAYSAYSAPAENVAYGPSVRYVASPYAYSPYSAPVVHAW